MAAKKKSSTTTKPKKTATKKPASAKAPSAKPAKKAAAAKADSAKPAKKAAAAKADSAKADSAKAASSGSASPKSAGPKSLVPKSVGSTAASAGGAADGALLKTICAEPDNLEVRLVYGDKLIERNDPRGKLIVEQFELAKADVLDPRYPAMLASVRRLITTHGPSWLGDFLKRIDIKSEWMGRSDVDSRLNAVFTNGFLERMMMSPEDLATTFPFIREREPITGVELLVGEGLGPEDRKLTAPKGIRSLKISPEGWFAGNSVGNVLALGFSDLREIDVSRCDLGLSGAKLFDNDDSLYEEFDDWVKPPAFAKGQIKKLVLHGCGIGDAGAEVLFRAEAIDGITTLDLGQCNINDKKTLGLMMKASTLAKLTSLGLNGNNGLKGGIDTLAKWDVISNLRRIALPQAVSAKELEALFASPSKKLRELDVSSARDLLKTPEVVLQAGESLTLLDIGTTSIGDEGFIKLLSTGSMQSLLELFANGCSLSDSAITALTKSKLARLVTLDISSNKLSDKALQDLAKWPGLEHVAHLRIGNNRKLTGVGFEALIASDIFQPAAFDIGKIVKDAKLLEKLKKRFGDALVVG